MDSVLRKEVICRIVERQMQGRGLIEEVVLQDMPQLHQSACEQFGTWDTALLYAGVHLCGLYSRRTYSREQVLQKIRKHCRSGLKPTVKSVCRHDYRLHEAALQEFGNWRQALVAAGLDLSRARLGTTKPQRISRAQVLDALQAWNAAGHAIRWRDICLENRALAIAARSRFRSWRQVIAAVAAPPAAEPQASKARHEWDKHRVTEHIRRRQQDGRPLNYRAVRKEDASLLAAARRQFGSWRLALAAAGVNLRPRRGTV
jgi:hypothetical protein